MAVKSYIPIRGIKIYWSIFLERKLLKMYFPFVKVEMTAV